MGKKTKYSDEQYKQFLKLKIIDRLSPKKIATAMQLKPTQVTTITRHYKKAKPSSAILKLLDEVIHENQKTVVLPPPPDYDLNVSITDDGLSPLAGVDVLYSYANSNYNAKTDGMGVASFTVPFSAFSSSGRFTASKEGYIPISWSGDEVPPVMIEAELPPPPEPIVPPVIPFPPIEPSPDGDMPPIQPPDDYTPSGNDDPSGLKPDVKCRPDLLLIESATSETGHYVARMKRTHVRTHIKNGDKPGTYTFYIPNAKLTEISLQSPPSDFDVFEGKKDFLFESKKIWVPCPAPDSILIEYSASSKQKGKLTMKFEKDELSNFYMYPIESIPHADIIHMEWKVACPDIQNGYWSTDLASVVAGKNWEMDALPPSMEPLADELINIAGISGLPQLEALQKLTQYCSSFGCDKIPPGDMIKGTFTSKQGSCRHRAMDFFVVANRLNIGCRQVVSDCHAWVELYNATKKCWFSIDLGGCDPGGNREPVDELQPIAPKDVVKGIPQTQEKPEKKEMTFINRLRKLGLKTFKDVRAAYQAFKTVTGGTI